MTDTAEVAVLIPAAGQGTRLGGPRKQFRHLGGKALLVQTLLVFDRHPGVHHLIVAAPEDQVDALTQALQAEGLTKLAAVTAGGATRQDSVGAALLATPATVDIVLVHDAVRPFVAAAQVQAVLDATRATGAAALAVPVVDTLRRGVNHCFGATVPRDDLFRMQTPQGFRRTWFEAAHHKARQSGYQATDDVDLVQYLGHTVHIVEGSTDNIKITTADDWAMANRFWPTWVGQHER